MPTPSDAPYKLRQRAAEGAIRASHRRVLVVDRRKLLAVAHVLAAGEHAPGSYAERRLRSLLAAMTPAERRVHAMELARQR